MFNARALRHRSSARMPVFTWLIAGILLQMACGPSTETLAPAPAQTHVGPAPSAHSPAGGAWLNVTGTIPQPGEPMGDLMVVVFDHPITPPKTADGKETAPLSFSPPIEGAFAYGPNYFSLKPERVPSDTTFKAMLNPLLRSTDGLPPSPDRRTLGFSSFEFKPNNLWPIEDHSDKVILGLEFPRLVDLNPLRVHLIVTDKSGKPAGFDLLKGTNPKVYGLDFKGTATIAWPITIRIGRGLADNEGLLSLSRDYEFEYGRPPEKILSIYNSFWETINETTQFLQISFSESVDPARLAARLKVSDISTTTPKALKFVARAMTADRQRCEVLFSAPAPYDVKVKVEVAAGLEGIDKGVLKDAWMQDRAVRTELLMTGADIDTDSGDEGAALRVSLNHPVDPKEFTKYFAIYPKVEGLRVTQASGESYLLHGDWPADTKFDLQLRPGIRFIDWATQKKTVQRSTTTPKEFPSHLSIPFEGKYYFPRTADPALPLKTRNLASVDLVLHRMFPSNIGLATNNVENTRYQAENFIGSWSEEVAHKKLELPAASNKFLTTPIKLNALMPPGKRGVFLLQVTTEPEKLKSPHRRHRYYYEDDGSTLNRFIMMTNIGVLAHWRSKELTLFAHDLYTVTPIVGARVRVFSQKNQVIAAGETNERGIVQLKDFKPNLGEPKLAVIEKGDDYTFLELKDKRDQREEDAENSEEGQTTGGRLPYSSEMLPYDRERYDSFVYADRALYRPGETVHLRWIGRKNYGDALAGVPLTLRVNKPNGKSLIERPVTLSAWGTGGLDLPTQKTYPTGRYEVQLSVPGETQPMASYPFQLEEFVPNRIKASVELPEGRWVGAKAHKIVVAARHLFGAPAENRIANAQVFFSRGWQPARWSGYTFNNDSRCELDSVPLGEEKTDKDGRATYDFEWKMPQEVTFPLGISVIGAVAETGGRKVNGHAGTQFFPSELCLGIAGKPGKQDGEVAVRVAAVKPDETPAGLDKVEVTLEKQIWSYSVRDYSTYQEPRWTGKYQAIETRPLALKGGLGQTVFTAHDYGYYRARVHSTQTSQYSTVLFYSFGGRCEVTESPEPRLVQLKLGKPLYKVGEIAELRIEAPFDGKAVVVIQGETIRRMLTVDVRKGVAIARFSVQAEDFPNAWLETTVIHAVDKKRAQVYPFASFEMIELAVDDPNRRINGPTPFTCWLWTAIRKPWT